MERVPKLRFPEFEGEWREVELGEIVESNSEPIPKPDNDYTRVGIYCHAKGTFQEYVPKEQALNVDTMYVVHKNNLIVNITFAWEHAIAITKDIDEGKLVSHRFPTYAFKIGQFYNFYKYLILDKKFKHQLGLASPGGAGRNRVLNKNTFLKINVNIPLEEEQRKIAEVLLKVDERISIQEKIISDLENQKKGLMQKLFNQEVRFKNDNGSDYFDWEEKKFENLAKISNKKYNPAFGKNEKCIELEHISQNNGVLLGFCDAIEQSSIKNVFETGDILFGKLRPYLRKYLFATFAGVCSSEIWVLKSTSCVDNRFLYYLINTEDFISIANTSSGTKMPRADWNLVSNSKFYIPISIEEQKKIADFLSIFDKKIQIEEKILEDWKLIKKGLIQQMFV